MSNFRELPLVAMAQLLTTTSAPETARPATSAGTAADAAMAHVADVADVSAAGAQGSSEDGAQDRAPARVKEHAG